MALITDLFEDSLPGLVVGAVATAVLMPLVGGRTAAANGAGAGVGGAARGRGRQLMKAAVRGYVSIADRLREATAEAREQLGDMVAEVREERRNQAQAAEESGDGAANEESAAAKPRRKRTQNGASRRR